MTGDFTVQLFSPKEAIRRHLGKELSMPLVMRALVTHDGWYAPAQLMNDLPDRHWDESVVVGDAEQQVGETVHVFTDNESLQHAVEQGWELGTFVGKVSGAELFCQISPRAEALQINPGTPAPESWSLRHKVFPTLRLWCRTVCVERAIDSRGEGVDIRGLTRSYPAYMLLMNLDRTELTTVELPDREGRYAVAFTAMDQLHVFLSGHDERAVEQLAPSQVNGQHLFSMLGQSDVNGLVINYGSSDPRVLLAPEYDTFSS